MSSGFVKDGGRGRDRKRRLVEPTTLGSTTVDHPAMLTHFKLWLTHSLLSLLRVGAVTSIPSLLFTKVTFDFCT